MAERDQDGRRAEEYDEAVRRGTSAAQSDPRASDAWYDAASGRVMVELTSGILLGFPPERAQGLGGASARELGEVEVEGRGYGLHWERLDVDLAVPALVAGVFGTASWMRELGRLGGSATSDAKRSAARANGRRGGRPRKTSGARTTPSTVHTLPNPAGSGWINKRSGRIISMHDRKDAAVVKGREMARSMGGEHTIHRKDGTISARRSYRGVK